MPPQWGRLSGGIPSLRPCHFHFPSHDSLPCQTRLFQNLRRRKPAHNVLHGTIRNHSNLDNPRPRRHRPQPPLAGIARILAPKPVHPILPTNNPAPTHNPDQDRAALQNSPPLPHTQKPEPPGPGKQALPPWRIRQRGPQPKLQKSRRPPPTIRPLPLTPLPS